jgi:hypothetical protein
MRVGGEEFDYGFEVECIVAFVHCGALRAAVGEELFGECFGDEFHLVWFLSLSDPIGPVTNPPDQWGPTGATAKTSRGVRSLKANAADVTAALRWRGRCSHEYVANSYLLHGHYNGRQSVRRVGPRAPDSPVPGESRMLEQPSQTKNNPVTKAPGHEGPYKESNECHRVTITTPNGLSSGRDSGFALARPVPSCA